MVNSSDSFGPNEDRTIGFIQTNNSSSSSQSSSPLTASSAALSENVDSNLPSEARGDSSTTSETDNSTNTSPTTLSRQTSNEEKSSLYCSVPLDKVKTVLSTYTSPVVESLEIKPKTSRKVLCLYCDRTFAHENLRQKHVERCHSSKQFRRVSLRKQQNNITNTPCIYCDKLSTTQHTLKELFEHMVNNHSNKYFGCLFCEDRFLTSTLLSIHNASTHKVATTKGQVSVVETTEEIPVKITRSRMKQNESNLTPIPAVKLKKKVESTPEVPVRELRSKKLAVKSSRVILKRNNGKKMQTAKLVERKRRSKNCDKKERSFKQEQAASTKSIEKSSKTATTVNPYPEFDSFFRVKKITDHSIDNLKISSLTFDDVFDKAFFNRIKCNIQENLLHHIDGKLFKNEESESRISNFEKISNITQEVQHLNTENYGCDLSLNALTPTTSLLSSQFGEDLESQIEYGSKPSKKKTQGKNEQVFYKYLTRRKYQASILEHKENRDLSKLDMWTQFVIKNRQQKILDAKKTPKEVIDYYSSEEYKNQTRREELNRILDRRGPFEDLKKEVTKQAALNNGTDEEDLYIENEIRELLNDLLNKVFEKVEEETQLMRNCYKKTITLQDNTSEIPSYLNLRRTSSLTSDCEIDKSDRIALICSSQETENFELPTNTVRGKNEKVELTGEWARSRIYICAACGLKLQNIKLFLEHKSLYHQNVWVQHYEFVGNQSELYRHLSIPVLGKVGRLEDTVQSKMWKRSDARLCTKCGKQCNSLGELHRHVLECGGDWTWMLVRKKCKYRPFGAKSRRKRRGLVKRIHLQKTQSTEKKVYKKQFDGPRPKPSDADTIQRMLANLPPKRATRKIICLKDGFNNSRTKQQTNTVKKKTKVKCGKVIHRKLTENNKHENIESSKINNKNTNNYRRSLRSLSKVLSSRILDTSTKLIVKRKYKKRINNSSIKSNKAIVIPKEDAQEVESKSRNKKEKVSKQENSEVVARSLPKRASLRTERKNEPKDPPRELPSMNIKRFFRVKKKSTQSQENLSEIVKPLETPKKDNDNIITKKSKKETISKKETKTEMNDSESSKRKRKLRNCFKDAISKIKKIKIDPITSPPPPQESTMIRVDFFEKTTTKNDSGSLELPKLSEILNGENRIEPPSTSIVVNYCLIEQQTKNNPILSTQETSHSNETVTVNNNNNAVPVAHNNNTVPSNSQKTKGKIRKNGKGLNDCIAMLTNKLNKNFGDGRSELNSQPSKQECILKVPLSNEHFHLKLETASNHLCTSVSNDLNPQVPSEEDKGQKEMNVEMKTPNNQLKTTDFIQECSSKEGVTAIELVSESEPVKDVEPIKEVEPNQESEAPIFSETIQSSSEPIELTTFKKVKSIMKRKNNQKRKLLKRASRYFKDLQRKTYVQKPPNTVVEKQIKHENDDSDDEMPLAVLLKNSMLNIEEPLIEGLNTEPVDYDVTREETNFMDMSLKNCVIENPQIPEKEFSSEEKPVEEVLDSVKGNVEIVNDVEQEIEKMAEPLTPVCEERPEENVQDEENEKDSLQDEENQEENKAADENVQKEESLTKIEEKQDSDNTSITVLENLSIQPNENQNTPTENVIRRIVKNSNKTKDLEITPEENERNKENCEKSNEIEKKTKRRKKVSLIKNSEENLFDELDSQKESKELRRSRRNSRKVASYNEIDLIDPLLDELDHVERNIPEIIQEVLKNEGSIREADFIFKAKNRKNHKKEKKINHDDVFDLLKTAPDENIVLSKPTDSFLGNFEEISNDFNDENFDTFDNILEKSIAAIEEDLSEKALPNLVDLPKPEENGTDNIEDSKTKKKKKAKSLKKMQRKLLGKEIENKLDTFESSDSPPLPPPPPPPPSSTPPLAPPLPPPASTPPPLESLNCENSNSESNSKFKKDKVDTKPIYCEICDKSFSRTESLTKHKRTLTHISKLSELEAKEAAMKMSQVTEDKTAEESSKNDLNLMDLLQSIESPKQVTSPFSMNTTNNSSLKLADIISDVLSKPVLNETDKNSFSDIIMQNEITQPEYRRYRSLGERKSFEEEKKDDSLKSLDYFEPQISKAAGTILEKQISLLQNMIESQSGLSYIDDVSVSSGQSIDSGQTKHDNNLPKIYDTENSKNFIKPQLEDISEDSNLRSYEEHKSRKILNRDEELFLECCSLLKSGSEVSNYSKHSNKISGKHNHLDLKVSDEPDWLETKNLSQRTYLVENYSDESRIETPLGDNFRDDDSNSETVASNWNTENGQISNFEHSEFQFNRQFNEEKRSESRRTIIEDDAISQGQDFDKDRRRTSFEDCTSVYKEKKNEEHSDASTSDSKRMLTKGALKVFEGLKVSIPTGELNISQILNSSPPINKVCPITTAITKESMFFDCKKKSKPRSPKTNRKKLESKNKVTGGEKRKKSNNMGMISKVHDIYDFEETQDNSDVFTKPDFRSFRNKIEETKKVEKQEDSGNSDCNDSVSFEAFSSSTSSVSDIPNKAKTEQNITKKKCMIMGRIFKNAAKSKIDEDIRNIPVMDNTKLVEDFVLNCSANAIKNSKMTEDELNLAFDKLLDDSKEIRNPSLCNKGETNKSPNKKKGKIRKRSNHSDSTDDEFGLAKSRKRANRKNLKGKDDTINLEQELKECIGVASRKSQRKCTSGKQNVLVEYWSSDESLFESMLEKQILETKPINTTTVNELKDIDDQIVTANKQHNDKTEKIVKAKKPSKIEKPNSPTPPPPPPSSSQVNASIRRKRAATNALYHWSSSSEDESCDLIEVKPIRDEYEDDDDDDRPVQHGWIVGDSPKKLVTMLAQAKGKKCDVDCVKQQGKKRTNAFS